MYCLIEVTGDRYRILEKGLKEELVSSQSTAPLRIVVTEEQLGKGIHEIGEEKDFPNTLQ